MKFEFKDIQSVKDLNNLTSFLLRQSLNYKNYSDWVEKSKHEIDNGYKKSVIAYSDGIIVGDVIYQDHKSLPRVKELKNIRMHPKIEGRGFAQFMVKQAEVEDKKDYDLIIVDAPSYRRDMYFFLVNLGYTPTITLSLYNNNSQDIVFIKDLKKDREDKYQINQLINHIENKAIKRLKDF